MKRMNFGIIIQARLGSTRLPGKILLPFNNESTILDFLLEKFHKIPSVKVIVATTDNPQDERLEEYLLKKGEFVYRGSEEDVLERFICAAEYYQIDSIIRICSDNPFLDPKALNDLVEAARNNPEIDYISYKVNGKPSILTHFGFWGEFVSLEALKRVREMTPDRAAHEHVTYYIYNHPETFKCKWLPSPSYLEGREDIRLTVDTVEDLENARVLHNELSEVLCEYELKDIVSYLDEHDALTRSMSKIINDNVKN